MSRLRRAAPAVALGWLLLVAAGGCGGPGAPRTTFLRSVDLVAMTDRMAASLAADAVIAARRADDDRWIVSMHRVVNHTNQIIPDREKWLYVARLRAVLAQTEFSRNRGIVWVIPPERWPIVAAETGEAEPYGLRLDPTHLLTAEFLALTNTSGRGRSDAYLCSYQLLDLATGSITWEDAWEVKRALTGRTYD